MATEPRTTYTLRIEPELLDALRAITTRDGISASEQIRRGIRLWLKAKTVGRDPRRPRAKARGRK
jgi:hypothetical protein